jgi:trimethylamine---corrinoid protein Co-methyltransferase
LIREAFQGGQYTPLSLSDIQGIHKASLSVLEHTGVRVENDTARNLFQQAGGIVSGDIVTLPRSLVEDTIASAPKKVLLAARRTGFDLILEEKKVHFGSGGSPVNVLDVGKTCIRPARLEDVARLARLADQLSELDFFVLPVTPTDIPQTKIAVSRFGAALNNTQKHIMGGLIDLQGARDIYQLALELAGSEGHLRARPFISCMISWMVSPLQFDSAVTDMLTFWCSKGIPVALSSAPMAGATSPVTLAGTIVQLNAEQLAGVAYTQLVRKGTPILAGYVPGQMNLKNGVYLGGTTEDGLMQAAATQMAHFYGFPIYCSAGMTDAKIPDQQAGFEKMMTLLLAALSGASYIHHAFGMLENMNVVSYEQMILDNDIVMMVKRALRGIKTDSECLAVDAIARVGSGNTYLSDEHTVHHMRKELVYPATVDRSNRAEWVEKGQLDTRARAARCLAGYQQQPHPQYLSQEIHAYIQRAFNISLK